MSLISTSPEARLLFLVPTVAYQVDFSASSSSSSVGFATKRRITWKFGFADRRAVCAGARGVGCRGEEHEVVLVWQRGRGLEQIAVLIDGVEAHHVLESRHRARSKRVEICLDIPNHLSRGDHILQIKAYWSRPWFGRGKECDDDRQFDMLVDGQRFVDMCKLYQLGINQVERLDHARLGRLSSLLCRSMMKRGFPQVNSPLDAVMLHRRMTKKVAHSIGH